MSSTGRAKRDRERIKQEKAALKRARRQAGAESEPGSDQSSDEDGLDPDAPRASQDEVLAELALLHEQFEDGAVGLDDFEVAKSRLIGQLDVG